MRERLKALAGIVLILALLFQLAGSLAVLTSGGDWTLFVPVGLLVVGLEVTVVGCIIWWAAARKNA